MSFHEHIDNWVVFGEGSGLAVNLVAVVMGLDKWNSLPAIVQDAILAAEPARAEAEAATQRNFDNMLKKTMADAGKYVVVLNDEQLAECIRTQLVLKKEFEGSGIRVHYHGCNKAGSLTRLLNPLLGGYLIFCNDVFTESSNMDQLDLRTAKEVLDGLRKITR
jgi:hypothetical protein